MKKVFSEKRTRIIKLLREDFQTRINRVRPGRTEQMLFTEEELIIIRESIESL